jgi:hypothetical protein
MATHFSVIRPQYFKALGLIAPYFRLYDEQMFDKYRGLYGKVLDTLVPTWRLVTFPTRGR